MLGLMACFLNLQESTIMRSIKIMTAFPEQGGRLSTCAIPSPPATLSITIKE